MTWIATVDESIRIDDRVYVLAACAFEEKDSDVARDTMRALEPRAGHRLHWHDRKPPDRHEAVKAVAQLSALHIVTVGAPIDPRRQERARRQCLETLLFHLDAAGVEQVWLESRNAAADRRDIAAVDRFRARRVIGHAIRIDHARPLDDPLLWLADIVAGALGAAEGGDPTFRELLVPMLTEHRIRLD
ncbi:hypothetical protein [Jiangella mangrovi]|uniref:DUF3800 domain-containing protein n=1 Tax=Jiangella mangrovi TaxID=1524084 RepID=A0A7W9LNR0_9ACTN|nr:hypothetical protein [Jiangella mangrovi]MBB5790585.1 hypothetical protein [Jiangella mangrovi]